jgi:hypothetical protein
MIRFKEFITEVRTAYQITKKSSNFIKDVLPNQGRRYNPGTHEGEHIGTVNGHHIYRHKHENHRYMPRDSVTYSVYNPKTRKSTVAVQGRENKHGVLSDLNLAASPDNEFPAHELYHHLLHHGHVTALVADHQSAGGKKVWEKLSKKRNVGIHGWDPRKKKPVNVKFGEDDTHEDRTKTQTKQEYDAANPDPTVKSMQLVAHKK